MGAETILKGNGRRATAGDKHYRGLSDPDQPRRRTLCRTDQALTGLVSTQQGSGSFSLVSLGCGGTEIMGSRKQVTQS